LEGVLVAGGLTDGATVGSSSGNILFPLIGVLELLGDGYFVGGIPNGAALGDRVVVGATFGDSDGDSEGDSDGDDDDGCINGIVGVRDGDGSLEGATLGTVLGVEHIIGVSTDLEGDVVAG
jgi:hypothetical protein